MNRSISSLVFLGSLVGGQVNVEIPLRRSANDAFVANVSIPTAGVRNLDMKISIGETNTISHPSAVRGEPSQTLILNHGSATPYIFADFGALVDTQGSAYLTIGPQSALTQRSGSVAFLRNDDNNSAKLIVGSTLENFESHCAPNSTVRLHLDDPNPTFESAFNFGAITISNTHLRFGATHNRVLFTVPAVFAQDIGRAIEANGGISDRLEGFNNCTQTTIASLPDIRITVGQRGTNVGRLVYFPEDYIDFADGNRCTLRVRGVPGGNQFLINPLVLPYTNLRISRTDVWELCDAADPTA